jgi:hypothetical protein
MASQHFGVIDEENEIDISKSDISKSPSLITSRQNSKSPSSHRIDIPSHWKRNDTLTPTDSDTSSPHQIKSNESGDPKENPLKKFTNYLGKY